MTLFQAFFLCFKTLLFSVIYLDLLLGIRNDSVAIIAEERVILLRRPPEDLIYMQLHFFAKGFQGIVKRNLAVGEMFLYKTIRVYDVTV